MEGKKEYVNKPYLSVVQSIFTRSMALVNWP